MNHPIPVTITHNGKPLDLSEYEVCCQTCKKRIEPTEPKRGYVVPHQHDGDGGGCSSVIITRRGSFEMLDVVVEGLDEAEMHAEHPTGMDKIVADAAKKMGVLSSGASEEWLLLQLRPFAATVMRWEREGCAQECDAVAKSLAEGLERMGERHDCYDSTHVSKSTAEDLAESIRDRDGTEDLADTAERLAEAEVEIRALREVLSDYPGRSIGENDHNNWCFARDRVLAREWRSRLTMGDHFERVVSAIEGLRARNAMHKRGFRLCDQPQVKMLTHALEEVSEIIGAHALGDAWQCGEEVGDAIACLVHYAVATGTDLSRVFERWLKKIPTIFPETSEPEDRLDLSKAALGETKFQANAHVSEGCCTGNPDGAPCLCKCHSRDPA